MKPHFTGADHEVPVEEDCLDDDVPREDLGRHHLRLRGRLDEALPRIGRVGNHKSELKVPFLQTPTFEQDFLLDSELFHGFYRGEVDLP